MPETIATEPPMARRQELRFPSTGSSVRSVRSGLHTFLDGAGMPPDSLQDLMIAACEAATNAIEHAQHPTQPYFDAVFEVVDGFVTIVIQDHGQWRDGPIGPHRGRGLLMMHALTDTTVSTHPHGTIVTIRTQFTASGPGDDRR